MIEHSLSMNNYVPGPLLAKVNSPADLKANVTEDQLPQLCNELRQYIVDIVSEKGGHFGASLGTVEMTAAIHYVFNTPYDQLVWDVGHQAYGHKILTGRREEFHTNRKYKGISGFPKRSESDYDTFGVGHSSTSISGALGMAVASRIKGEPDRQVVAVIGDGAMTAGLAFEGLNHGGAEDANVLVILNDNCMSIDPISESLKGSLIKESNLFEALNWRYFGPIDGHDVEYMVKVLRDLRDIPGPKILHVVTMKGKGYEPAEKGSPTKWHAPGLFNKETGEIVKIVPKSPQPPLYQDVFGHTIIELAEKNEKIVGVTPAMPSGCSLKFMMEAMPKRAFDVGIAEQHAVTFSAGMATQGLIPFCNIYSSFMQRAFDQVVHDVALQNLHVVLCLDRGGLVGADGATHHGAYDIAYMRCIPNMIVASPMNESELRNLMYTAQYENYGVFSIRYPRGNGMMVDWKTPMKLLKVGTGRKVRGGEDVAFLTIGPIGNNAQKACEELQEKGISAALYDMRFAKPIDEVLLHEVFSKFKYVITVEDGCIQGGMGSAVLEFMADNGYQAQVKRLGIPDAFIEHGTQDELYAECGFDANAMVATAIEMVGQESKRLAINS